MAKYSSKDVGFLQANGRDLKGFSTMLSLKVSDVNEQTTVLGDDFQTHASVGVKKFDLSQSGFFDDVADGINDALKGQAGLPQIISFALAGNTIGQACIGFEGPLSASYERLATLNALHKANAGYQGRGQVDEGVLLQPKATKNAGWDTEATSVDNAASSASGGAGILQVAEDFDLDGYTDLVVTVRDSADDITFADLVAFTAVTAGPTAERKTVAGTVERYLAVSGAFSGAGTAPVATVSVMFTRF